MNKYRNKKIQIDRHVFDSIAEGRRYRELALLQRANQISNLELQKKYLLLEKSKDERAVYYIADFYYIENGQEVVEDVKSKATAKDKTYILKRKMFKQKYKNIDFREVIY